MNQPNPDRIVLVGCGNMGRAILDGWLREGAIAAENVAVADPQATDLPDGVIHFATVPAAVEAHRPDTVVLAVKPQLIEQVAANAGPLPAGTLVLSILAGTELARLADLFPGSHVVRFMGNLAAQFGMSPIGVFAPDTPTQEEARRIEAVLGPLGPVQWLEREDRFHAFIALAGSGPGFVFRFLDTLTQAGVALGFDRDDAAITALAMLRGSAEIAGRSGNDFAALASKVASKGGTTQAGLDVLDANGALVDLIKRTLRSAADRSVEMARE